MGLLEQFNQGRQPKPSMLTHSPKGCYAIIHFGINTFTDREWGYGDEAEELFNPTEFDADLLVQNCIDGGLDGLILVCKHHDGFCLWPTATTEHNISKSPWRDGKGDLVREVVDACRRRDFNVGFYVSPWDRNSAAYGTSEYLKIYQAQLRELYANYGKLFEVWFDGANGGDGYYGGAREKRPIDPLRYYDWPNTWGIVRALQPDAAIFSDVGPELRWVGNEQGYASLEAFGSYTPHSRDGNGDPSPAFTLAVDEGQNGHPDGKYYMPAECDVPLRPGWFYHPAEDGKQRSVETLLDIYLHSVGCGQFLDIGLAPDRRGRLCDGDVLRLKEFKRAVDTLSARPIAVAEWRELSNCEVTVDFGGRRELKFIEMAEDISGGEKVLGYRLLVFKDGIWQELLSGQAIGRLRLKLLEKSVCCEALKFQLTASNAPVDAIRIGCFE